jgi:hypothetical protein
MVDTSTFVLTVDGESVPIENVVAAWQNLGKLLAAMERAVVGDSYSPGRWHAENDPVVKLTASVNGVSKEQLDQISLKAAEGLVSGSRSGHFPKEFGDEAIQAARNVLRLLRDAESLTIYTEKLGKEVITTATLEEEASLDLIVGQVPRRKVYSAIEGVLKRLSVEGKHRYTAAIKDRYTAAVVEFRFGQEHLEAIGKLFDKNVVAEGVILFAGDLPLRFLDVPSISERARNTPLRSFVGILPPLLDGEMAEDFLERLNDADTSD